VGLAARLVGVHPVRQVVCNQALEMKAQLGIQLPFHASAVHQALPPAHD
jgi:hypothetical protein